VKRVANAKTIVADAFTMADPVLYSGVACTDLVVKEGLLNLDLARESNAPPGPPRSLGRALNLGSATPSLIYLLRLSMISNGFDQRDIVGRDARMRCEKSGASLAACAASLIRERRRSSSNGSVVSIRPE
jgi:hypothetical protein